MLKKVIILLISTALIFSAGCWSKRELDELAIVLGTAIDKGQSKEIKVSVEVAQPRAMGSGDFGGGSSQEEPVIILNNEGITTFDAIRGMVTINSRKLFFSHNQIILISEEIAKNNLTPVVDFFERDPELRTEVPITVTSGKALELLNLRTTMETSASTSMQKALQTAEKVGKILYVQYHDFLLKFNGKITSPVVPYLKITETNGRQTFKCVGMAVFKGSKMVGLLNEEETKGLLWVLNRMKNSTIVVPGHKQDKIIFEVVEANTTLTVKNKGGKPNFRVNIETKANLAETQYPLQIMEPEEISILEGRLKQVITKQVTSSLKKAQKDYKADIFGFGEKLRSSEPKLWKGVSDEWDKIFPESPVIISAKVQFLHSGQKTDPTRIKKN